MLELPEREILLAALIPPDGYALDFAVATTYSLDLIALLTTPIAFSRWSMPDGASHAMLDVNSMVLLNAVHEFSNKLTVFCEAGRISVPQRVQPLLKFLEEVVVEVTAPAPGRVFHPKAWALRYTCQGEPTKYRVLVSSRNLTFSRSWDTLLTLDGELTDRTRAFTDNRPLGEFFAALADMAPPRRIHQAARNRLKILSDELPRVAFDAPLGVDRIRFHPLGHRTKATDPIAESADRILVVSPFLTAGRVGTLAARAKHSILVSTVGALSSLAASDLAAFDSVLTLRPDAEFDTEATITADGITAVELRGLHAKLYIAEQGWNAHVFTGSANATDAAGNGNVEFLVELVGKRSILGIDRMLRSTDREVTFRTLLQDFGLDESVDSGDDEIEENLEKRLETVRAELARLQWTVEALTPDGEGFDIHIGATGVGLLVKEVDRIRVFPTTLPVEHARDLDVGSDAVLFQCEPLSTVTSLIALEITASDAGITRQCRFVVNAELVKPPTGRVAQILSSQLHGRGDVLKYLFVLLGERTPSIGSGSAQIAAAIAAQRTITPDDSIALLEPLLRTLDRDPARLDYLARFLSDLEAHAADNTIPSEVRSVLEPIMAVARDSQ